MKETKSVTPLSWNPKLLARLYQILEKPHPEDYAVFDWDHTCVYGDCQDTVFRYQLTEQLYKKTPPLSLHPDLKQYEDEFLRLEARSQALKLTHSRSEILTHPDHLDFIALGIELNERYLDHPELGPRFAYQWILRWLEGFSSDEISSMAHMALSTGVRTPVHEQVFAHSPQRRIRVQVGLRPQPEIQWLLSLLRTRGVKTTVVTASLELVIQAIASDPQFGFHIPRPHVKGMRFPLPPESLFTWRSGKVEMIRKEIHPTRSPLIVIGDSNGDYEMLTAFPDLKCGIVIEKSREGDIGKLYDDPRYFIQRRNLKTGEWCR